ncbi:MAG TPA: hypothetical protein VH044_02360, partial [Polyangiaceae bacterium]|nr:hypothetical protein [Polyangiaceae bacterium]
MQIWKRPGAVAGQAFVLGCIALAACSSTPDSTEGVGTTSQAASTFPKSTVDAELESGDFNDALATAEAFLADTPTDCSANYAALIASSMLVVDS